ncbi:hypothetical protein ID866_2687 [Astraeus odoratus]|nr:hypothetical protein ID866_2687 [Astraeus odoratus]
MLGVEAKSSPVRGKVKHDGRWRANWWDFYPLVEHIQRCASTLQLHALNLNVLADLSLGQARPPYSQHTYRNPYYSDWIASSDGSCRRLPSRGPFTPVSNPTLLMVTQSHELHVCYLRSYLPSLKIVSCSLSQPYFIMEGQARTAIHDVPSGPKSSRLCISAAIALMYNESSFLVAMRSRRYPSLEGLVPAVHNDLSLDLPLDLAPEPISEDQLPPLEWGALAEELTIELCEVKIRFDGWTISLLSNPLPPLHHSSPHLTNLAFTCIPPSMPDPSISPRASPKKDKQPVRHEPTSIFLVASFLDCDDRWSPMHPRKGTIIAMLADVAGSATRGGHRAKEVAVGCFTVLQLPDLVDDPEWDRPSVMSLVSRAGTDWPVNIAVSANHALLCASSMIRISTHLLPRLHIKDVEMGDSNQLSPLAMTLVSALLSRRSIADIAHVLSMASTPIETVVDTLSGVLLAYDVNARTGCASPFTLMEAIGAGVEIYRSRAHQMTDDDGREYLTSLWRNGHRICSIASIVTAFGDCKESDGYDLDAVWQLVSISEWAIGFLENLMRECLSLADLTDVPPKDIPLKAEPVDDNPFLRQNFFGGSTTTTTSSFNTPIFLHLVHPLLLANLIEMVAHVNRLYQSLNSMRAKVENAQIARDILLDMVDSSGLNLEGLEGILKATLSEVSTIPGGSGCATIASKLPPCACSARPP